ncbi:MAG: hypothetical protein AAF996_04730 [Pseudomonadota bacterium]
MAELNHANCIGILTTQSVAMLQRLEPERVSSKSVMCINRTSVQTGISRDYNAFVRPETGMLGALADGQVFRADVTDDVTEGESWQLGMYLAHSLRRAEMLRAPSESSTCWLATGVINADLEVNAVSGMDKKLAVLSSWLEHHHEEFGEIILVFPSRNDSEQLSNTFTNLIERYPRFRTEAVTKADQVAPRSSKNVMVKSRLEPPHVMAIAALALISIGSVSVILIQNEAPTQPTPMNLDPTSTAAVSDLPKSPPFSFIVQASTAESSCYSDRSVLIDYPVSGRQSISMPADTKWCDFFVRNAQAGSTANQAYIISRNSVPVTPQAVSPTGQIQSVIDSETKSLEVMFVEPQARIISVEQGHPKLKIIFED